MFFPRTGPLLWGLAAALAGAIVLYSGLWMRGVRMSPSSYLGVDALPSVATASIAVRAVTPDGPASRAGLRSGDRILAIDGRAPSGWAPIDELVRRVPPGNRVRFLVQRPGAPAPFPLDVVLEPRPPAPVSLSRRVAHEALGSYPLPFVLVALVVLFLRVEDRNAWRLALLFAGFIAAAPLVELNVPPVFRGFSLAFKVAFEGLWPATFLYFFSVFPASSPLDRRLPWLKRLWLAVGATVALPLAATALVAGRREALLALGQSVVVPVGALVRGYFFGGMGLGLVSLVSNAAGGSALVQRKSRVILWGMLAGFVPSFLLAAASSYSGRDPYEFPFWVWASCVLALFLVPLSFAYAVVRHRVLEIPMLLRRSARYLLVQRGFAGLIVLAGAAATFFFARSFGSHLGPGAQAAGVAVGAGFGTTLVWAGTRLQKRVRGRIDRAFFRRAYDVRQVLEDLAHRARGATSREDLAALLDHHVTTALHPRWLEVFLEARDGTLALARPSARHAGAVATLSALEPVLLELARRGRPWDLSPLVATGRQALGPLSALEPDCLVPILGRDGQLTGLLVLGAPLSEDPYSGEDQRLLASVASQAGIALDSLSLAEQMAERLEAEGRAEHEMDLAKQVQSRLLPEQPPSLRTLECAARCVQARAVGGDYYDFLELGAPLTGLVLADISGKGFPAALLMASLQATLRSRLGHDMLDLPRQLRSVNQLLYRSSAANRYATLFLGVYDDTTRRLTYANCGHNPPVLLREDGSLCRLAPTAPVLGLLEEWECESGELSLANGDLLALFSDGITEAFSDAGEEFGEERLIELLRANRGLEAAALVDAVSRRVTEFSGQHQEDDMTLLVARVR